MLYAFLDESGTHKGAPVMCVTGVLFDEKGMNQFRTAWKRELANAGIALFHMTDYFHSKSHFKAMERQVANDLYGRLIGIINLYCLGSRTACVRPFGVFDVFRQRRKYTQYTICAYACIELLSRMAQTLGHTKLSLFIESGHKNMGELKIALKAKRKQGWCGIAEYRFTGKEGPCHIQTADICAFELLRRMKDLIPFPAADEPRQSFAEINEDRNHKFTVMTEDVLQTILRHLP